MKIPHFDGIYQERWGFSWAMLVYRRVIRKHQGDLGWDSLSQSPPFGVWTHLRGVPKDVGHTPIPTWAPRKMGNPEKEALYSWYLWVIPSLKLT